VSGRQLDAPKLSSVQIKALQGKGGGPRTYAMLQRMGLMASPHGIWERTHLGDEVLMWIEVYGSPKTDKS